MSLRPPWAHWLDYRREKKLHRTTAANCKFWIGDNSPVDWGTCTLCVPDQPERIDHDQRVR